MNLEQAGVISQIHIEDQCFVMANYDALLLMTHFNFIRITLFMHHLDKVSVIVWGIPNIYAFCIAQTVMIS